MMEILLNNISIILVVAAVICTITSIFTELTKEIGFLRIIPTSIQVTTTSVLLTVIGFIAYAQYKHIQLVWYTILAAGIVGVVIGYITMFGWDNLISKFKNFYKSDIK